MQIRNKYVSIAAIISLAATLIIGQLSVFPGEQVFASGPKITLTSSMVTNETVYGDLTNLVDEQAIAGDPLNGTGGSPTTEWFTGFQSGVHPVSAYIDLGESYDISDIYLRDGSNSANLEVSYGSPGNWTILFTDNLSDYHEWNDHAVDVETRYLRFTKTLPAANANEVVIYGSPFNTGGDTTIPAAVNDLLADSATANSVDLTWTAPGDDGSSGTATSYDIRYATSTITEASWSTASQVTGEPSPSIASSGETMTVSGLSASTTYYFALKTMDEASNESDLSNIDDLTTLGGGIEQKIVITPSMVLNEIAHGGDASTMVDEQAIAGDPLNGTGGSPVTNWWLYGKSYPAPNQDESWWIPAHAFIDLGAQYHITKIYYYDTSGSETDAFQVSTGEPFNWNISFTDSLNSYNSWVGKDINTDSRFVRFTFNTSGPKVNEMVIYGWPLETPEPPPTPTPHTVTTTMDEFIGINAFIDDPYDKMAVAGSIREYHVWGWDDGDVNANYPPYPNNLKKWNPSFGASLGKVWNFDQYYEDLQQMGISVSPVIQTTPAWLESADYNTPMTVPTGMDATDPATYEAHADHMYQYAARFGSTAVPDANLKLAPDQPRSTGLGVIDSIENWNEQNGDWHSTRKAYFTPYEFAAMTSADYDGHMGTMGSTFGVKNADPNMKFLLGGFAGYYEDLPYLRAMKVWTDYKRNGDFPADILNFHHYCQNEARTVGVSPEECNFKERTEEIVDYRDMYLPGKEIWISEFGYDTHPGSKQAAPEIGSKSNEEVQADWLIRSYLALAAAGVDKAQMYMLRDVNPAEHWIYGSSGLVGPKGDWTPKVSWYHVYTMKNRLKGLRYDSEQASGNANVMIYRFKDESDNIVAYALWSPTSNDTQVSNYQLSIPGSPSLVELVTMADGDTDGIATALTMQNGSVSVDVSESPIFVMVDREMIDTAPVWPVGSTLTKTNETESGLTLTWTAAQDDIEIMNYNIYQNDVQIGSVYGDVLTFDVVNLSPIESYEFRVEASDEAGHATSDGPTIAGADSLLPGWSDETELSISNITSTGLTIEWTDTALDNGMITDYRIYVDDVLEATIQAPLRTYDVTGLTTNTMYKFKIEAGDDSGNWSTLGPVINIETI